MSSVKVPFPSLRRAASPTLPGWPMLRLGCQPFYLAGALLAALCVPLWVAGFLGALPLSPAVPALYWHVHEMIFGVAVAIIIGFFDDRWQKLDRTGDTPKTAAGSAGAGVVGGALSLAPAG